MVIEKCMFVDSLIEYMAPPPHEFLEKVRITQKLMVW